MVPCLMLPGVIHPIFFRLTHWKQTFLVFKLSHPFEDCTDTLSDQTNRNSNTKFSVFVDSGVVVSVPLCIWLRSVLM